MPIYKYYTAQGCLAQGFTVHSIIFGGFYPYGTTVGSLPPYQLARARLQQLQQNCTCLLACPTNQPTNQSSKQPPTTAAAPTPAASLASASLASAPLASASLASAARSMTELACAFITAKVHFLLPPLLPEPDRVGLALPDCSNALVKVRKSQKKILLCLIF